MTELILVRHSRPHGGVKDPGLTDFGRELAESVARWLVHDNPDVLVSSPLVRARETGEPLARMLGKEIVTVEGLLEWEGVPPRPHYIPMDDYEPDHPAMAALIEGRYADFVPPFDREKFRAGAAAVVDEIFERWPVDRVVAFCHGGIINAMLDAVLAPRDGFFFVYPAYTSISIIERVASGRTVIRSINDTGHLLGDRRPGTRRPGILDG